VSMPTASSGVHRPLPPAITDRTGVRPDPPRPIP
jgi:hypothetical protein